MKQITENQTPEETAEVISDKLMDNIKSQFAKTSQSIQINQDGKKLTNEEICAMKKAGIKGENWYAVIAEGADTPYAIFQRESWAAEWKEKYSRTAKIEPWPMIIR